MESNEKIISSTKRIRRDLLLEYGEKLILDATENLYNKGKYDELDVELIKGKLIDKKKRREICSELDMELSKYSSKAQNNERKLINEMERIKSNSVEDNATVNITSIEEENLDIDIDALRNKLNSNVFVTDDSFEAGKKLFKNDEIEKAEEMFLNAINSNADNIQQRSHYYLGRIYMKENKLKMAEDHFVASKNLLEEDYSTSVELGKCLSKQGRHDEAIKLFDECEKYKPKWEKDKPKCNYHIKEKGKTYIEKGNPEEALKQFELAISENKEDYSAYISKIRVLVDLKGYDEAREEINNCDILFPDQKLHKSFLKEITYRESAKKRYSTMLDSSEIKNIKISESTLELFTDNEKKAIKNAIYIIKNKIGKFTRAINAKKEVLDIFAELSTECQNLANEDKEATEKIGNYINEALMLPEAEPASIEQMIGNYVNSMDIAEKSDEQKRPGEIGVIKEKKYTKPKGISEKHN